MGAMLSRLLCRDSMLSTTPRSGLMGAMLSRLLCRDSMLSMTPRKHAEAHGCHAFAAPVQGQHVVHDTAKACRSAWVPCCRGSCPGTACCPRHRESMPKRMGAMLSRLLSRD